MIEQSLTYHDPDFPYAEELGEGTGVWIREMDGWGLLYSPWEGYAALFIPEFPVVGALTYAGVYAGV